MALTKLSSGYVIRRLQINSFVSTTVGRRRKIAVERPKTAKRLRRIGVLTVNDLLHLALAGAAELLGLHRITTQTIRDWQDQARLVCQIPAMHGHDLQMIVASGLRAASEVAAEAETFYQKVRSWIPVHSTLWQEAGPDRSHRLDCRCAKLDVHCVSLWAVSQQTNNA